MGQGFLVSIEDVILDRDRRGMAALRDHLPPNFCREAAQFILERPGTVLIATGFYILGADAPETDGPPGAVALGNALHALGYGVAYVSDRYTLPLLADIAGPEALAVDFPIADDATSESFARDLLERLSPSLVVAVERCGRTASGAYLNMWGQDITPYTAKLDYLFLHHRSTVAVGDGGNEIGMGNLAQHIPSIPTLPRDPAATTVHRLVIAGVSNWGAYGLVAALSLLRGVNLLPSPKEEEAMIRRIVDLGAVDGMARRRELSVDGFPLAENALTLARLGVLLAAQDIQA